MCHVHDEMKTVLVWVLGVGCWVLGVGCWVLGVGCWVLGCGSVAFRFLSANLLGCHQ